MLFYLVSISIDENGERVPITYEEAEADYFNNKYFRLRLEKLKQPIRIFIENPLIESPRKLYNNVTTSDHQELVSIPVHSNTCHLLKIIYCSFLNSRRLALMREQLKWISRI